MKYNSPKIFQQSKKQTLLISTSKNRKCTYKILILKVQNIKMITKIEASVGKQRALRPMFSYVMEIDLYCCTVEVIACSTGSLSRLEAP